MAKDSTRHGQKKYSVLSCQNGSQAIISSRDEFGEPGPRCRRHEARQCSVQDCKNSYERKVSSKDKFNLGCAALCMEENGALCQGAKRVPEEKLA